MTTLIGKSVNSTTINLLQVDGGITGSLKVVEDGFGNDSALQISSIAANIVGTFSINGSQLDGNVNTDGIKLRFISTNLSLQPAFTPQPIQFNANTFTSSPSVVELVDTHTTGQTLNAKRFTSCVYIGARFQDANLNYTFETGIIAATPGVSRALTAFSGAISGIPLLTAVGDDLGVNVPNIPIKIAPLGSEYLYLGTADTLGIKLTANNPIVDSSNNELISFTATGSAVNQVNITNASTGTAPVVGAVGGDTNINISIQGKGTGIPTLGKTSDIGVQLADNQALLDNSNNELVSFSKTASAVNQLNVTNAATATNPILSVIGGDTNIGLTAQTKGTGAVTLKSASTTTPLIIASGTTYQHTTNITIPNTAATRTITLPDEDVNLTPVAARAYVNGVVQISSTPVKLVLNATSFDTGSYFNTGTYRFTPLIAGYYKLNAQIYVSVATVNTYWISLYKNGSQISTNNVVNALAGTVIVTPQISDLVFMNGSTDYIEVFIFSGTATAYTVTTGSAFSYATFNRI